MIFAIIVVPDILISLYIILLNTIETDRFGILSIVVFNILFYLTMLLVIQKKEVSISEKFYIILFAVFVKNIALFLFDTIF